MAVGTVAISRTPVATGNRKTYTLSYWLKRGDLTNIQQIWNCYDSSSDYMYMRFTAANELYLESKTGGAANIGFTTNRLFQDPGAWYHIVLAVDTAQSVSTNRWKVYINGVDEADTGGYSASDYSSQDVLTPANTDTFALYIGADHNTAQGFNGEMSHVQMVDGLALAPTEFGEFDSTSGIWKLKTGSYATPGTNGFHLKMEDRANLDLDSSSNAFTFTTTGTLTATYDNPSNNFATLNPSMNFFQAATFSNGNNTIVTGTAISAPSSSTLGVNAGKWYWEVKQTARSDADDTYIGVLSTQLTAAAYELGHNAGDWAYYSQGASRNNNGNTSYGDSWATDDIIGFALDLTNNKLYFSKNNTWQNSGDPTSGGTGTGALSITQTAITDGDCALGYWFPAVCYAAGAGYATLNTNFGNGYFGTTAVTSAEADGDGIGAFEYAPPTGYFAICTKNIKAY